MTKYLFPAREPFNAYSHLVGVIGALIFMIALLIRSDSDPFYFKFSFLLYGITVILMFGSSAIYHMVNVSFRTEELFRKIDHMMIYLVIAGSYTPICAITLEGSWRLWMLAGIWGFAVIGILKKVFWMSAPRWFSTALYLAMGWVSLVMYPKIWPLLPLGFFLWIFIGGLFYTIGAIIYGIQKPDPYPEVFGFHEIWHLFVMGGAFSHFWAIYYYLPGFQTA